MDASMEIERSPGNGLRKFRRGLSELYGERLERAVLYGSRARGDAHEDSDYDVAVFLKDLGSHVGELYKLADMATDILQSYGIVIHAMPFRAGSHVERTPIMHEIRKDGRDF